MDTTQTSLLPERRLAFIDAWRGIAAFAVMVLHLYFNSRYLMTFGETIPSWLVLKCGLGVEIFFVMSGFVIAYSLRDTPITLDSSLRFALRRQLRLDPPYWATLGILLLLIVADRLFAAGDSLPSVQTFVLNCFYLEGIVNGKHLLGVAWTLCIEIQFYTAFLLLLMFSRILGNSERRRIWFLSSTLIASAALSMWHHGSQGGEHNYFLPVWFHFAFGVLVCWALESKISRWVTIWALIIGGLAAAILRSEQIMVGTSAGAAILAVGARGHLHDWMRWPVLQFYGKISYSLYLIHAPIGAQLTMSLLFKVFGPSALSGVVAAFCAILTSTAAAYLLHISVERPSMQFAKMVAKTRV